MKKLKLTFRLLFLALISISVVIVLFLLSENKMHRNNAFVRRFPHHPITKKYDFPLKYNSYYMAGYDKDMLYLGNTTAPLHVLEFNLKTKDTSHIQIELEQNDFPFRSATVKLNPPYFFVSDGTVPCIFRGKMGEWKAKLWMKDKAYFSRALPIDSNKIFIKTISSKTNEAILGLLEKQTDFKISLNTNLLEKQFDGIFDVDGVMVSSQDHDIQGYVYYYRNQFLIMNSDLKLLQKERTIDTVQTAQIQLSQRNKYGEVQMKAPPLVVNKTAALFQNLLLINSNRLGKYEEKKMLDQASIIDVYNWEKNKYTFSFYVYNIHKNKVREFQIYDQYLLALIDDVLSIYQLKPKHFKIE